MTLSIEMSWSNPGTFCFFQYHSILVKGWLKGTEGRKSKENFCRNNVHTFSGRQDCHGMFKGTFLPDFPVITEAKIISSLISNNGYKEWTGFLLLGYFYTSPNGALSGCKLPL